MKIILQKDNQKLGLAGDIVTVKDGYARNYLIPQGLANKADGSAMKIWKEKKRIEELAKNKDKRAAEKVAAQLKKLSLTAKVTAGEDDKIFGAVTTQDIAQMLKEKGFDIDRRKIILPDPIKELGVYMIPLKINPKIETKVKLWVIKD